MNISLTPELESFVQAKVRSGRYNSASEVIREALRLLDDYEKGRDVARLAGLRGEIDRRLASLDRRQGIEAEKVFARLRQKSGKRHKKRA
jgi:antitoxin ParD1/3/4